MKKSILAVLFVLAATASAAPAEEATTERGKPISISEALQRLQEGNARFAAGESRHPHEATDWRQQLEEGQRPFAVVLGCSDSRVPPELVFDQGFGDLFVIRVAGNVVDTDVTASIEYAVDHLDTSLVVIMGHSHCGAVTATIDHLASVEGEPAEVVSLLARIEPAVAGIASDVPRERQIAQGVQRNVERAVRGLSRVPDLQRSIRAGKVKVVGAVYDMHTGKVELLDQPHGTEETK